MIPRILHQTWKTDTIPVKYQAWRESWERHNPGWQRILWSDRMLLDLVAAHYPDFLPVYCGYTEGIRRADAARYLLLHHFGGLYADIDCECVGSLEMLAQEDRVVFCLEPAAHFAAHATPRGLPYLLFNGTIASPPKHPFWPHLLAHLPGLAAVKDTLDSTGPCLMTSAQLSYKDQAGLVIHPASLFSPIDSRGDAVGGEGPTLSIHHWESTWWTPRSQRPIRDGLRGHIYRARYALGRLGRPDEASLRGKVSRDALAATPPAGGGNLAILVPLRDAADLIAPFLDVVGQFDYPKDRIKLVFCEGDSRDDSWERLKKAVEPLRGRYRDIVLTQRHLGTELSRAGRHRPRLQLSRRSGLARVRNHLIEHGLDAGDDWALWVDIDVWRIPPDTVNRLMAAGRRIVVPNCVTTSGGKSFDMNNFVTISPDSGYHYLRHVRHGLYQPPADSMVRRHLSDLRHLDEVALDAVGGTMLLVDATLHRGGLRFPETPYRDLIETEAFGALAKDLGVTPYGLPKVEILHVPW